jgi:MoaA/NifB/PqqE/SkfB family radical SAM enzyme
MIKQVITPEYNMIFDTESGDMMRFGRTVHEDPLYSPIGPELADIEISTICNGIHGIPCAHCYKSNGPRGENMTLETFKKVFHRLPGSVTQIAFGIGDIYANPEMFDIFRYCREHGVIPNVTINGTNLTPMRAQMLAELCGAVAVSLYDDTELCFLTVQRLHKAGLKQVNIHAMLSEETFLRCNMAIQTCATKEYRNIVHALVFLSLKQVGRGSGYTPVSDKHFKDIVEHGIASGVTIGFDSCSCNRFMDVVEQDARYAQCAEPCESTLFSIYINVHGDVYPCSFCEHADIPAMWKIGNILDEPYFDFLHNVWYAPICSGIRAKLLEQGRNCLL